MLDSISGVDHIVIATRDLAAAAAAWQRLGFTIAPRGVHSAHLGTANHTIMLTDDYIELLGVVAPTPHNAPTRVLLEGGDGLERIALRARDAQRLADELAGRGIAATGPLDFGRPVDLPAGGRSEARFRTVFWPVDKRPGGARLFACEHLTPDVVWLPELTRHANTAERLVEVTLVTPSAAADAALLADMLDAPAEAGAAGWRVATAPGAAAIRCVAREPLLAARPELDATQVAARGTIVTIAVASLEAAVAAAPGAMRAASRAIVPASAANGVAVVFEAGDGGGAAATSGEA